MLRFLAAVVFSAVALFLWGMFSWMVLGWHDWTLHNLPQEVEVVATLKTSKLKTGAYHFPGLSPDHASNSEAATQDMFRRAADGPVGFLAYSAEGIDLMNPRIYGMGFVLNLLDATLAATLMTLALPSLPRYFQRVFFVSALGLFGSLVSHAALWNWMHFPADYSLVMFLDVWFGWTLGGFVMAAFLRPQPNRQQA